MRGRDFFAILLILVVCFMLWPGKCKAEVVNEVPLTIVDSGSLSASSQLSGTALRYRGISIFCSAGPCHFRIRNQSVAACTTGDVIIEAKLAIEDTVFQLLPTPLDADVGLCIEEASGAMTVQVSHFEE